MSTPTRPAGRYGDDSRWRRRARLTLLALLAVALTGWAVWEGLSAARGVSFTTQSFVVVDDASVKVAFTVTKPKDATATCRVQALSSTSAQVGLAVVTVGPGPAASVNRTVTIRTQQPAVTGVVQSCAVT